MKVNQGDIVRELAERENIQIKDSERVLKSLFNIIIEHGQKKDVVHCIDLGTFEVKDKEEYIGRDPRTKEEIVVPAASYPKFKPSIRYKNAVKEANGNKV